MLRVIAVIQVNLDPLGEGQLLEAIGKRQARPAPRADVELELGASAVQFMSHRQDRRDAQGVLVS